MAKRKQAGGPITAKVRQALNASDLSLYAIGRQTDIAYPLLHRFVAGERDIRLGTLDRLAPCLGLELIQKKSAK
jgi:hypothetical protein